jgi:hypothetical protein
LTIDHDNLVSRAPEVMGCGDADDARPKDYGLQRISPGSLILLPRARGGGSPGGNVDEADANYRRILRLNLLNPEYR